MSLAAVIPMNLPSMHETAAAFLVNGANRFCSCTECANLNAIRWANPAQSLSTAELIRLYHTGAHEPNGGRTTDQMLAAVVARYHHTPARPASIDAALELLRAGYVLAVAGDYGKLGTSMVHPNEAFARGPDPWHCVTFGPIRAGDVTTNPIGLWRDPLMRGASYHGRLVNWFTVLTFAFGPADMLAYPQDGWV